MWRLWLLSHKRSLSLELLYLRISVCTLTRSKPTSILAWSATIRCHYWILVRNTAFITLVVWIGISRIVLVKGRRISRQFWLSQWYDLRNWLWDLNRHSRYVRLGRFQVYTRNFCLSTLDSSLFLSRKLFWEEYFLCCEHLGIFQGVQFSFFLQFLLLLLCNRSFSFLLRVLGDKSFMTIGYWSAGRFPRSAWRNSRRGCLRKWASLLLRLWSRKLRSTLKIGFSVTYATSLFNNRARWLFKVGVCVSVASVAIVLQWSDVSLGASTWVSSLEDGIGVVVGEFGVLVMFGHHGRRVLVQCFIARIAAFFEFRRLWLFVRDVTSGLIDLRVTVVIGLDFIMVLPLDVGLRRRNFVESTGRHRCFMCRAFISVNPA